MPLQRVKVVVSDRVPEAEELVVRPLLAALETRLGLGPVVVERQSPASLADDLAGGGGRSLPPEDPVVIVLAAGEWQMAGALADLLATALPATLLLLPGVGGGFAADASGVITADTRTHPDILASMLVAIAARQRVVRSLAGELTVAQRASGGLRGEMDRLHEELNLASLVQREFMPRSMPSVDGYDFGVLFRPTGYVSGDIYQVRPLGEHHVSIFLADAVGHGVPAALLTMILTNSLRPLDEHGNVRRPVDVLASLNRDLCEQQQNSSRFATAVYGVLDTRTRRVTLAGAGHPPPLIIAPGRCDKIETDGPLLGVFAEAEFTEAAAELPENGTLLLYTDGFEVGCPGVGAEGVGSLRKPTNNYVTHVTRLLSQPTPGGKSASFLMAELVAMLDEQAGSLHQPDDITAIAIAPCAAAGEPGVPAALPLAA